MKTMRPTSASPRLLRSLSWPLAAGCWLLVPGSWLAAADAWQFDVVRLKNGRSFQGVLLEEGPAGVRFQCVKRQPGERTLVFETTFEPGEVARVERLDGRARERLARRLQQLDPRGERERQQMASLELVPAAWGDRPTGGWGYSSDHFRLRSNAREETVRLAAVRLEQIYAAYTRFLPPRRPAAQPTTILLVESRAEYEAVLRRYGLGALHAAFYVPAENQVVGYSYLRDLRARLERVREQHELALEKLHKQEAQYRQLYRGEALREKFREVHAYRQRIAQAEAANDLKHRRAVAKLFEVLYHEAFHAYLANYVYPADEAAVPRWLNEGLAQVFETALVEAGELRVGHAPLAWRDPARDAARQGRLVPLADLLRAGPKQFLVDHASAENLRVADRHYLTSWALAFYLAFGRRLLGTPELDRYVQSLRDGADAEAAFQQLIGEPLPRFETAFHQYVANLRVDGSLNSK